MEALRQESAAASSEGLLRQLYDETQDLKRRYNTLKESLTKPLKVAPAKPREGDFAFADGTNWNPGAGRGLYQYVSGAWAKL